MNAILLASMAMLPQFMQNMMGYDSFTSGLTMMPRGIGCLAGVIICGKMSSKIDPRILSFTGVLILCLGSWSLGFLNLEISPLSVVVPNILYGLGMTMGMIPVVTLSCKTLLPEQMSNASGLQNFIKTIGGAVGTSLVATFISRFSQKHQFMMVDWLRETNSVYMERLQAYIGQFSSITDISTATHMAESMLYNQLNTQAHLWAYIDSFRLFAVAGLIILFLIPILKVKKN